MWSLYKHCSAYLFFWKKVNMLNLYFFVHFQEFMLARHQNWPRSSYFRTGVFFYGASVMAWLICARVSHISIKFINCAFLPYAVVRDVQKLNPFQINIHFTKGHVGSDSVLFHMQNQYMGNIFHDFRSYLLFVFAFLTLHLNTLWFLVKF